MNKKLQLHDYEILGLELLGTGWSKGLALKLKSESDVIKIINFNNVSFLDCSNFSWQNVISEVHILDVSEMIPGQLAKAIASAGIDMNYKVTIIEEIREGHFIDIRASVGAQIILICDEFHEH